VGKLRPACAGTGAGPGIGPSQVLHRLRISFPVKASFQPYPMKTPQSGAPVYLFCLGSSWGAGGRPDLFTLRPHVGVWPSSSPGLLFRNHSETPERRNDGQGLRPVRPEVAETSERTSKHVQQMDAPNAKSIRGDLKETDLFEGAELLGEASSCAMNPWWGLSSRPRMSLFAANASFQHRSQVSKKFGRVKICRD
jgi:hypothetical protein